MIEIELCDDNKEPILKITNYKSIIKSYYLIKNDNFIFKIHEVGINCLYVELDESDLVSLKTYLKEIITFLFKAVKYHKDLNKNKSPIIDLKLIYVPTIFVLQRKQIYPYLTF